MDKREFEAQKLQRDHDCIKTAAMKLYRQGILDEKLLSHTIDKAFNSGHQAGFLRGQIFNEHEERKKERQTS